MVEPWPSVGHVYAQVAGEQGFTGLPPDTLTRQFFAAWKLRRDFDYSRAGWAALVDGSFAGLIPVRPSATFFPAIYDRFAEPAAWRVYEDVWPTLEELRKRGLRLGVISNWDERLEPLLGRLGLADFFNPIVVSQLVGACKPQAEIFKRALEWLGVEPGEVLHVGDSAREDVAGAKGVGMQARRVARGEEGGEAGVIRSLGEVVELLDGVGCCES